MSEVSKWAALYRDLRADNDNAKEHKHVVQEVVMPMIESLRRLWGERSFSLYLGTHKHNPLWINAQRRKELERVLQVWFLDVSH